MVVSVLDESVVDGVVIGVVIGVEAGAVIVLVVDVLVSVCVAEAGDGFTIVVLFSVFSGAGEVVTGATVSDFCSHAERSATLARMQMYFFII